MKTTDYLQIFLTTFPLFLSGIFFAYGIENVGGMFLAFAFAVALGIGISTMH